MKIVREIISILISFIAGAAALVFLSYTQKTLVGYPHACLGYVVPTFAGGAIGVTFYSLYSHLADQAQWIKTLSSLPHQPALQPLTSRLNATSRLTASLLLGAALLCLFSVIQKALAGYPIEAAGFVVPLLFGSFSGAMIGTFLLRNRRLLEQERLAVAFWQQERDKTTDILTSIADGLIVTSPRGNVELANEAAAQLLEIPTLTMLGQTLPALLHHASGQDFSHELNPGNRGNVLMFNVLTRDGRQRSIKGTTSAVHNARLCTGAIILLLHDNTEEQRIDRMKSEFISTAAHNLKTPITAITGYSELLMSQQNLPADQQQEYLGYIYDKAWQLDKLINDLMAISRVEAGRDIHLHKEQVTAAELLESLHHYCQTLTTPCILSFDVHDAEHALFIDLPKLTQALENIISNAVKFSPRGGQVVIQGRLHEQRYLITVCDQGIGMTEEQLSHIFDKFYRADATDTARNGIGLGLTLTKSLIEAHGGQIHATSTPDQGTSISISLPIRSGAADAC